MRFLSLFSGLEAATVAWAPLGWQCVAVAEIEPFPCALLAYHYPNTPNLGDVTKITAEQIKSLGPIDLVVFGSPCQDLSVCTHLAVRRLTPIECERLMGFSDTYTKIPYRKKTADRCADSPRYKALGNSMAVPVIQWIGRSIAKAMAFQNQERYSMTHTSTLNPCRCCNSPASAYRAPTGVGYQVICSNPDCPSRHASNGIAAHVSTQGAAALWNRRQGVSTT